MALNTTLPTTSIRRLLTKPDFGVESRMGKVLAERCGSTDTKLVHSFLLFLLFLQLATPARAALTMSRIARLPAPLEDGIPCGDADHNYVEVYGDSEFVLVAFECLGRSEFRRISLPRIVSWTVWSFGDGDNDGRMELLAQRGDHVVVYEAPSLGSLPSESVWSGGNPEDHGYYFPQYVDLDADGKSEIAIRTSGEGIWLFENSGDNCYQLAAMLTTPPFHAFGRFDGALDFDRDGLNEIAVGDLWEGLVHVFEATGYDDQYVLSAVCTTATIWIRDVTAASDMDRDGWPEFVGVGPDTTGGMRVMVFEAIEHARYRMVWDRLRFDMAPGAFGNQVATGDVNGDGAVDFAVNAATGRLILYTSDGPDSYIQAWAFDSVGPYERLFDVNRDGRDEVLFNGPHGAEVWEDTEGLAVAEMTKPRLALPVAVQPAIAHQGMPVQFLGIPYAAAVEIHSLDGRLVCRTPAVRQSNWTWNLRDQTGNLVPAGTYFAVIRSKGRATSLKLCVVK